MVLWKATGTTLRLKKTVKMLIRVDSIFNFNYAIDIIMAFIYFFCFFVCIYLLLIRTEEDTVLSKRRLRMTTQ